MTNSDNKQEGEQLTCHRGVGRLPCVDVQESAGAHGALDVTHVETALAEHGPLLVCHLSGVRWSTQVLLSEQTCMCMCVC